MSAAVRPGHVFFVPATRGVFRVTDPMRGDTARLREVFGERGLRLEVTVPLPPWIEDLGHPGDDIGPAGWMALRDGVLAAEDHAGRVDAVQTAWERAAGYGPAGQRGRTT